MTIMMDDRNADDDVRNSGNNNTNVNTILINQQPADLDMISMILPLVMSITSLLSLHD